MKQYLTREQTAKLIELGFARPRIAASALKWEDGVPTLYPRYTIGELLSFLPEEIDCNGFKHTLYIFVNQGAWDVEYSDFLGELYSTYRPELIDAIFDICVKLKEEGVI